MLKVILKRVKPQAEEIIAEEQAGFIAEEAPLNRPLTLESCVKSTSNSRICTISLLISNKPLTEYVMQPYRATMRKYNISATLFRTTEQLYDKATRAVQMNGSMDEWLRTSQCKARMSSLTQPLQHFSRTDHV